MPQRDAPPPAAPARRQLPVLVPLIGLTLLAAVIGWRRPGPGFQHPGVVAAVLGFVVLAAVAYRLELTAGRRQARAAEAVLDAHDAGLPRTPAASEPTRGMPGGAGMSSPATCAGT